VLATAGKHHAPVNILFVVLAASAAGFALILLLGRGQGTSPAASAPAGGDGELEWVLARGPDGLERLLRMLFGEMGFEVERADRAAGGGVDLVAVDARPIRGGRVWVHGAWPSPGEAVDGEAVRALLDAARGEAAGKAVLVTLGRFTAEAREAARDAPVELVDGAELAALVKRHLPQAWATREI